MKTVAESSRKRPAHGAHKASGIEWLGEVPEHWDVLRLKYSADLVNEKVNGAACGLPYTGLEHIESWTGKRLPTEAAASSDGQASGHRAGDVLFGKLRPYLAKAWVAEYDGACTSELLVLRPQVVLHQFLRDYILNPCFISVVDSSTYGAKMPRASWDFIGNLPVLVPPLDEQRAIAAFLDRETARIDALIEKKRRQIELLHEKRAAMISQAVTKGLDWRAPMKKSEVEGLGEIPATWTLKRLKFATPQVTVGIVVTPSSYYVDEGIPCLRSLNIREGAIIESDIVFISAESNDLLRKSRLRQGDLVAVRTGQPGTTAVVDSRFDGANCIDLIIVRRAPTFDSRFMCYVMNSALARSQYLAGATGAIQEHFNVETAGNMLIPFPSLAEQIQIREYLDEAIGRLHRLAEKVRLSIVRLREYRAALISAAVTGKIDARQEVA